MTDRIKDGGPALSWQKAVSAYVLGGIVMFGVTSAAEKGECELRAHDAIKCRVYWAVPAAIFWPFAASYALADAMLSAREGKQ